MVKRKLYIGNQIYFEHEEVKYLKSLGFKIIPKKKGPYRKPEDDEFSYVIDRNYDPDIELSIDKLLEIQDKFKCDLILGMDYLFVSNFVSWDEN